MKIRKNVLIFGATISRLQCPAEDIEQKNKKSKNAIKITIKKVKAGKNTFCLMKIHVFDKLWKGEFFICAQLLALQMDFVNVVAKVPKQFNVFLLIFQGWINQGEPGTRKKIGR